jgi:DNA polymerase-3 subunit epsilon
VHPDALAVHGITDAMLADKPAFPDVARDFLAFIEGANLVAHNAGFDIGFVNAELARLDLPLIASDRVVDTLALARRKHPMGPNSLDALCRRYGIDNSRRTRHGALLDSELLAEVYVELIGGRQAALILDTAVEEIVVATTEGTEFAHRHRPAPLPARLSPAEREAHAALVSSLGDKAVWLELRI